MVSNISTMLALEVLKESFQNDKDFLQQWKKQIADCCYEAIIDGLTPNDIQIHNAKKSSKLAADKFMSDCFGTK